MRRVTLNPNYSIRNEIGCSYILPEITFARRNNLPSVIEIPPLYGHIMSKFNGGDYSRIIDSLIKETGIKELTLKSFIEKIIENKNPLEMNIGGEYLFFPERLLVEDTHDNKIATSNDFSYTDRFVKSRPNSPFFLNLMFTSKCKTDCSYCYADRSRKDDMELPFIKKIIKEAYLNNIVHLQISGGDIFAYTHWRIVFEELKKYNYKPFLSTKVPLGERDILFLIDCGFESIQFSLDSLKPNIINKIIKRDGLYVDAVLEMFGYASKHKFNIDVKTVLTSLNATVENVAYMQSAFIKFTSITSWNLIPAFYSSHQKDSNNNQPSIDQLQSVSDYLKDNKFPFAIRNNVLEKTVNNKPYENQGDFLKENKGCAANTYAMSILSNGMASICEMLYYNKNFYIGDIRKQSLNEIWNSKEALSLYYHNKRLEDSNKESPCYLCEDLKKCKQAYIKKICYVDIANAFNNKWDYPDPRCPKAPIHDTKKVMTL